MKQVRDGQDLELKVSVPTLNDEPFDMENNEWDIAVHGTKASVNLKKRGDSFLNAGQINANAEITDGLLRLYCKSSKNPFGKGGIVVEMTIYAPNTNFEDNVQVLKTLYSPVGITLI